MNSQYLTASSNDLDSKNQRFRINQKGEEMLKQGKIKAYIDNNRNSKGYIPEINSLRTNEEEPIEENKDSLILFNDNYVNYEKAFLDEGKVKELNINENYELPDKNIGNSQKSNSKNVFTFNNSKAGNLEINELENLDSRPGTAENESDRIHIADNNGHTLELSQYTNYNTQNNMQTLASHSKYLIPKKHDYLSNPNNNNNIIGLNISRQESLEPEYKGYDHLDKLVEEKITLEYDKIQIFLKGKVRQEYEDNVKSSLKKELKKKVEKEIYDSEYPMMKKEITEKNITKITNELQVYKVNQMNELNQKVSNLVNFSNYEEEIKGTIREKFEKDLNFKIYKKEKEHKAKYLRRVENYNSSVLGEVEREYKAKTQQILKDINEMKSSLFRLKCSEKLKLQKIADIRKEINQKQNRQMESAWKIEKNIMKQPNSGVNIASVDGQERNHFDYNQNIASHMKDQPFHFTKSNMNQPKENSNFLIREINDNRMRSNVIEDREETPFNLYYSNVLNRSKGDPSNNSFERRKENQIHNSKDKSVNLYKINNKIRNNNSVNPKNVSPSKYKLNYSNKNMVKPGRAVKDRSVTPQNFNSKEASKTQGQNISVVEGKENNENNNSIVNNTIPVKHDYKGSENNTINQTLTLPKDLSFNIRTDNTNTINTDPNQNGFSFLYKDSQSLKYKLEEENLSLENFGSKISKHIESEENYRTLYVKESKSLKLSIKSLFNKANQSEHCLTDFLMEQWDKIDIAFENRYKILSSMARMTTTEIYTILDQETEQLTDYMSKTAQVYSEIKHREKLKTKFQLKANKNTVTEEDKRILKQQTDAVVKQISKFESSNIVIVWKGIRYIWLINYEKWLFNKSKLSN